MPQPLKKQRAVYPLEDPASEDSSDSDEQPANETIDVDFEAFKADECDFHGIKALLEQSLRGLSVDTSGLANIIISQNYVGSVIRQAASEEDGDVSDGDDENDVFGLCTVINLTSRKDEDAIMNLRSVLVEKCNALGSDGVNRLLREHLSHEGKHTGLLISERLVNLPAQLAIPAYDSLLIEIDEANKKGLPFKFTYCVLISKIFKLKPSKMKKKVAKSLNQIVWSNAEEEIFFEACAGSFDYSLEGAAMKDDWSKTDDLYVPGRRVMIIEATKLPSILGRIKEAVAVGSASS